MNRPETPIYLDYNATTPIDPVVVEAMLPYLRDGFGNPSSTHFYGRRTQAAVDRARQQVAALLGATPSEIVFTGGGTDASNHAIKGTILPLLQAGRPATIVTTTIEHPATLEPCAYLERLGATVRRVGVNRSGRVDLDVMSAALDGATLVSVMHSNNEVGTLQPIREIAALARARGVLVHTDAAQSLGKVPVDVGELGVDFLTLAGHKLYAPKGVGVLYVRDGVPLEPLLHGAGHESSRRAGTENVPYIVGLGMACEIAKTHLAGATDRLQQLRDRLWNRLRGKLAERVVLNGHPELRLPNTLNVSFVGHFGGELLAKTPCVAASTGSACHEGIVKLSPVLRAMGVEPEIGKGAVRLSVGRFTTDEEIDRAAEALIQSASHS
jgi:cysteine desulfurase